MSLGLKSAAASILNVGGDILKILFGTLTQSDAKKYTQYIQKLEDEQQSFFANSTGTDGLVEVSYYVI